MLAQVDSQQLPAYLFDRFQMWISLSSPLPLLYLLPQKRSQIDLIHCCPQCEREHCDPEGMSYTHQLIRCLVRYLKLGYASENECATTIPRALRAHCVKNQDTAAFQFVCQGADSTHFTVLVDKQNVAE